MKLRSILLTVLAVAAMSSGVASAQQPAHVWSAGYGGTHGDRGLSVAIDASGNVIFAGYFWGSVDFGGGPLVSALDDPFLVKLDSNGNHIWSQHFFGSAHPTAIATDATGNTIMCGDHFSIAFDGDTLTTAFYQDFFLAKFDANGNHLWHHGFGDFEPQTDPVVAVDPSGNVIFACPLTGEVDFGGGTLSSPQQFWDVAIAKFDPAGNHVWSQSFGEEFEDETATGVGCDANGNIYITGTYSGDIDFGGGTLPSASANVFVAKFDANGNHVWSDGFGDTDVQEGTGLAVNSRGVVAVTGTFFGSIDFGGGVLTDETGVGSMFVASLNADGNPLWSQKQTSSYPWYSDDIDIDPVGNVAVVGEADYGAAFVTKYTALGALHWSGTYGGSNNKAHSVALGTLGTVVVTGGFWYSTDFGGGPLPAAGGGDAFLVKYENPHVSGIPQAGDVPGVVLYPSFPNPFNPTTTISFELDESSIVHLDVFGVDGAWVRTLAHGPYSAGVRHYVTWNGRNSSGDAVASGVYLYRLTAGDFQKTRRAVLLK